MLLVAAIVRKAGEPLVIEEVIVAPPKAREVRIKIICTSLCHSDVTFWKLEVRLVDFKFASHIFTNLDSYIVSCD